MPATPSRYRVIADDLRRRIIAGEFPVGTQLPTIDDFQEHYDARSLNTIRQAQQVLVGEGLIETRQGVGAFVIALEPNPAPVDVAHELRALRSELDRLIAAVERTQTSED